MARNECLKVLQGLITVMVFVLLLPNRAKAQNEVAIGSATTKSNAILWLNGNGSQGLILPVVTNKSAVSNPDKGMIIYDQNDNKVWYRNETAWVEVGGPGGGSTSNLNLSIAGNQLQLLNGTTVQSSVNIAGGTAVNGAFMVWNGSSWQYTPLIDVSGTNGQVVGIKGKTIPALPTNTQALVYDGTAWKFQPLTGGTDSQTLTFTSPNLSISNGNSVNLSALDKDAQTLTLTGSNLSISGGNAVTLPNAGVTSVTAGTGLTGGTITTTGTINVDVGTTANKILQLDGTGKLPAVDGSQLINLPVNGDITGVIAGTGLTGGGATGIVTLNMSNTGITPGIYGSATAIPQMTIDAQGRITGIATFAPLVADGSITGGNAGVGVKIAANTITDANILSLNASKITSGSLPTAQVPNLDASKITTGIFTPTQIPGLDAGKIISGVIPTTQGGTGLSLSGGSINQGQLLIGTGGAFANANLTQGSGIIITNGPGSIALAVDAGNTANKIVQLDNTGRLPAVDGSLLINLPASGDITDVIAGTGLSGGGTAGAVTLDLANTSVSPATYGSAIAIPQITVDAQGRITGASTVAPADNSATNEIQNLSLSGAGTVAPGESFPLNISSGTGVTIREGSNVQIDQAANVITINSVAGGSGTVTDVSGTAPISVATGTTTPVISISQANTSTNGYLSSADWNTFNSKGNGTVTNVTGIGPISVATGSTTPAISITQAGTLTSGFLSSADWNTFSNKQSTLTPGIGISIVAGAINNTGDTDATNDITTSSAAGGDLSGNFPNPTLSVTAGTGANVVAAINTSVSKINFANLTIPTADAATTGLLSNTDWNTFNSKGTGTVSSVALSMPSIFTVTGSPVTTSGALNTTLASQTAATVFAAPAGSAGVPSFRTLVVSDIPVLNQNTSGTASTITGNIAESQVTNLVTDLAGKQPQLNGTGLVRATGTTISYDNSTYLTSFSETDPSVSAINGLVKSNGTTVNAAVAGTDYVAPNATITGGTSTKITYDAKGLVTSGTTLVDTDIPNLDASKITTGTFSIANGGTGAITPAAALTNLGALGTGLTDGNIFVGSAGNVANGVPLSGDATVSNTGLVTLSNGPTTRTNLGLGSLATLNAVSSTEITDLSIINDDINAAAAIAGTKIAPDFGTQNIVTTGTLTSGTSTTFGAATMTWPAANAAGALTNDGTGSLIWAPSTTSSWGLNGNSLSGGEFIGSTNAQNLVFKTNSNDHLILNSGGTSEFVNEVGINAGALPGTSLYVGAGADAAAVFDGQVIANQNLAIGGSLALTNGALSAFGNTAGIAGQVLTSQGAGQAPVWSNSGGSGWGLSGNTGLTSANYIGPQAGIPFNIRIGNVRAGWIDPTNNNTTFGLESGLDMLAGGINNTAMGYLALTSNTTGDENIAIGYNSIPVSTVSSWNTAVGKSALFSLNGASGGNTAIGYHTLRENTTGGTNTALGYFAGSTGSGTVVGTTTGSNNTFIGSNSGALSATISNATAIGADAAVTTSNSLILGGITGVNGGTSVNVGIGTTSPTQRLHVIGNILATGTITPSDLRYKKSIEPITNALQNVSKLNGVTYYYRTGEFSQLGFNDNKQVGVIAQEIEKIYPELVTTDANGYKAVDYSKLTPILVEAIKELNNQNEKLNNELIALESEKALLESKVIKFELQQQAIQKDVDELKRVLGMKASKN